MNSKTEQIFGVKSETSCKKSCFVHFIGRHGGLMVNVLDSGLSSPRSSPVRDHCVEFSGGTSHSAFLHPGV